MDRSDKPILATMTGEYFQPVRLHYRVFDQNNLVQAFERLRCVARDPTQQRWVWLYDHEAKNLHFKQSYAQIPKDLHPLVLGSFFLRAKDTLLLDLRSCERALLAIPFFDKYFPRAIVKVTEAEVANKLFSAVESPKLTPDSIFDRQVSSPAVAEGEMQQVAALIAQVPDPLEKLRIAREQMQSKAQLPLPEIERIPINYYEDGITGFTAALTIRKVIAMHHWLGDTKYSLLDVIRSVATPMAVDPEEN